MTDLSAAPLKPPVRPLAERGLDLLVWGGIAALLIVAFRPVEMGKIGLVFTNSAISTSSPRSWCGPTSPAGRSMSPRCG
ncbi:MAG: hypothetical protein WDN45_11595 [Caulobacteraceae bacterium]